jgi:hypothetical protein
MVDIREASGLEDEELVRLVGLVRVAAGAGFFLFPGRVMRLWTGRNETSSSLRLAARSLGIRDLAIGLGTLIALENHGRGPHLRGWLEAGALSDSGDLVAMLGAWGHISKPRAVFFGVVTAASVVVGLQLAAAVDD